MQQLVEKTAKSFRIPIPPQKNKK